MPPKRKPLSDEQKALNAEKQRRYRANKKSEQQVADSASLFPIEENVETSASADVDSTSDLTVPTSFSTPTPNSQALLLEAQLNESIDKTTADGVSITQRNAENNNQYNAIDADCVSITSEMSTTTIDSRLQVNEKQFIVPKPFKPLGRRSEEERKEYFREKKAISRANARINSSPAKRVHPDTSSVSSSDVLDTFATPTKKEERNRRDRERRLQRKLAGESVTVPPIESRNGESASSSTQPTPTSQFSPLPQPQEPTLPAELEIPAATESIATSRKRRGPTAVYFNKKIKDAEFLPNTKHNTKIRVGWMNLFKLETESIVIPYYGEGEDYDDSVHSQYLYKLRTPAKRKEFENNVKSVQWQAKMSNYKPMLSENDEFYFDFIHATAPVCKNDKFTVVTEADLRASYFSILYFCDSAKLKSVGIPLLGKDVFPKRSLAVGLETIWTYFKVKESTSIELIYLVTRNEAKYDELMELNAYFREFDLTFLTQDNLDHVVRYMFDRIKDTFSFATVPGTDAVCRTIKSTRSRGKAKEEEATVAEIHRKVCHLTGIPYSTPVLHRKKDQSYQKKPKTFIAESYDTGVPVDRKPRNYKFFQCTPSTERLCGSYTMLRKLWVISYYYMYFSDLRTADIPELLHISAIEVRKQLCKLLKPLHKGIAHRWEQIRKYCHIKCNCTLEPATHNHHPQYSVFQTQMSHYDEVYDQWIHADRTTVFSLYGDFYSREFRWTPRTSEDQAVVKVMEHWPQQERDLIEDRREDWYESRELYFQKFSRNTRAMFEKLKITDVEVGQDGICVDGVEADIEHHRELIQVRFDPDSDGQCHDEIGDEKIRAEQELKEAEESGNLVQIQTKIDALKKVMQDVHWVVWYEQNYYDARLERAARNRIYKRQTLEFDKDAKESWINQFDEPNSADLYLTAWRLKNGEVPDPTPVPSERETSSSDEDFGKFPKLLDLGDRTVSCYYCGALAFPSDKNPICCKKGQVYIDPFPRIPSCVEVLFARNMKKYLISANAAFAMASISYTRAPQKAGGVQSMKVKGLISFHPSALRNHPNSAPRFANFIVLDKTSAEIADMRIHDVHISGKPTMKSIFQRIQKYLDDHNQFVESFKNMLTLEQEAIEAGHAADKIRFKIVPTLADTDLGELQAHKGVYAKPSRMGDGLVTVAYSMDPTTGIPLPRGLTIYPTNPTEYRQRPLSIFSENVDPLCYTLLHPDGLGRWGLHKYKRWNGKANELPPSYIQRKMAHIEYLRTEGKDPEDFYDNIPEYRDLEFEAQQQPPDEQESHEDSYGDADSHVNGEEEENEERDDECFENPIAMHVRDSDDVMEYDDSDPEDDPDNMGVEDIVEFGLQEDLQNYPVNTEVGTMPNIRMEERLGQIYPVLDSENPTIPIPYVVDDPFEYINGAEGEEIVQVTEEEEGDSDRPQTLARIIDPVDPESQEDAESQEDTEKQASTINQINEASSTDESEGPVVDRYNAAQDYAETFGLDEWLRTVGPTAEAAMGSVWEAVEEYPPEMLDQDDVDDDEGELAGLGEDVRFGDEYNVEATATGRKNDGIQNCGKRKYVSLAEYATFVMKDRKDIPNRYQGKTHTLGQLILIDWCCRVIEMRMRVIQEKRAEFSRAVKEKTLFDMLDRMTREKIPGAQSLGMLVSMPSTVPGTSKYQQELIMSAITQANELGRPHLFITFTGNPRWPEIQRECQKRKCEYADIPEFVNNVFFLKAQQFLDRVLGKKKKTKGGRLVREPGTFGRVKWYNYSVEFQQRGMPHIHLLLSLFNPIVTPQQIDKYIKASVPRKPKSKHERHYAQKLRYYNYVVQLMTHTPCQGDPKAYCNLEKKPHMRMCTKGFPKKLKENTEANDNEYPDYRRTKKYLFDYKSHTGLMGKAGSEYVVSHNPALLMEFGCHINVEVVSSIKTIKYMFKYIHKGSDRVLLDVIESLNGRNSHKKGTEAMTLRGSLLASKDVNKAVLDKRNADAARLMRDAGVDPRGKLALNDCHYFMDHSAMTAMEAVWKLNGLPMHGSSHIIHRGYIHEESNDLIYFRRGLDAAQAGELLNKEKKSMLTAWFEANKKPNNLPDGRTTKDLTFPEMFKYFRFDVKNKKFVLRKYNYADRIFGRIQAPQPRYLELTATRILAQNRCGPTSFEELRTVDGIVHPTCLDAARALRLMNGEIEWDAVIKEVGRYRKPYETRRIFASILLHCAPVDPNKLFEDNRDFLLNDNRSWTPEQKLAHALKHIMYLLRAHGMDLHQFELEDMYCENHVPEVFSDEDNADIPGARQISKSAHKTQGNERYKKLNDNQRAFVDRALHLALKEKQEKQKIMFVDGPGGTGKTFCYTTIYHLLKAQGLNVTCVAHTGIAACLLPFGSTAHRKFSIPIEVRDDMMCNIIKGTQDGDAIKNTDVVIWDEACMTDSRIYYCVDRLFRDCKDSPDIPFAGTLFILGGDWRQILPIVEGIRGPGIMDFSLKRSELWDSIEKFQLTVNQRAASDPNFANLILAIGDGRDYIHSERQLVRIDENLVERGGEKKLVDWVFPDVNDIGNTITAALLTTDNRSALRINDEIIDRLDGDLHELTSIDEATMKKGLSVDPAIFATETPQGMPPHKLRLTVGAQIVLLRNISVDQGLCNGTRLTVKEIGADILICKNNATDVDVFLHRFWMTPTGAKTNFRRKQFPVRLAYAMTINKSQGQTLTRAGLLLNSDVFTHGQLYVAMSRVRDSHSFRICHYPRHNNLDNQYVMGGILVKNVVYKEILR